MGVSGFPRNRRIGLDEDEQRRLLKSAPRLRAAMYLPVLDTGIRRKELNELKVGDFVFDTPAPFVVLSGSITKNRKPAHMQLRSHVLAVVKSILPDSALLSEWVFHNRVPRVSTIKRDLAKAGIQFETEPGGQICTRCASPSAPTCSTPECTRAPCTSSCDPATSSSR